MKKLINNLTAVALVIGTGLGANLGQAATTDILVTQELPAMEIQEATMLTVSYGPGEFSTPHRHDAHTFVYVLEGELEMQVQGGELRRLGPGDTFYENPDDIHVVSRNVSQTAAARFLVFFIKAPGTPITVPVNMPAAHH